MVGKNRQTGSSANWLHILQPIFFKGLKHIKCDTSDDCRPKYRQADKKVHRTSKTGESNILDALLF